MDFGRIMALFELSKFYMMQALVKLSSTEQNRTGYPTHRSWYPYLEF
jgi:hypothetical protein